MRNSHFSMRVLLVRLSSFGDVVFTLPAAKALKRAGSGVEVAWAIEETLARHVADRGLALVEHLTGRPRAERTPDVAHLLEAAPEPEVAAWLADRGTRPFAVLQPFSSSPPKEWRAEHVLDFARRAAGD